VITLTTDFGLVDGYQGVLEGVIAAINPEAHVIAISHQVPAGDIDGGRYLLKAHHRFFPPGAIHLAIVDPGVGSSRKIIALKTKDYIFIGPDNGLFSFFKPREIKSIFSVTKRKYALKPISPVFHGRDIMAPAAAYASTGVPLSALGPKINKINRPRLKRPIILRPGVKTHVIWVDRFGNLVTDFEVTEKTPISGITVNGQALGHLRKTFGEVAPGRPLAYIGSGGHLEIGVNKGSALYYFSAANIDEIEIFLDFAKPKAPRKRKIK